MKSHPNFRTPQLKRNKVFEVARVDSTQAGLHGVWPPTGVACHCILIFQENLLPSSFFFLFIYLRALELDKRQVIRWDREKKLPVLVRSVITIKAPVDLLPLLFSLVKMTTLFRNCLGSSFRLDFKIWSLGAVLSPAMKNSKNCKFITLQIAV